MGSLISSVTNKILFLLGFAESNTTDKSNVYFSAEATVAAAELEGISVCDYVERLWSQQGCTQSVINKMKLSGAFETVHPNILEIGAGTGRYLEKVIKECLPAKYESYETARDWASWIQSKYSVLSHEADGVSLKQTADNSIDLVHAHGVFVYLPFLVSYRYWKEIWRVVKPSGIVVFDICSENCFDEMTVDKWLKTEHNYPCFLSKEFVVTTFGKHEFSLVNSFYNRYGEGSSEYLIFVCTNKP